MSEFTFFGTTHDTKNIINEILHNTDLYLIPCINYKSRESILYHRRINTEVDKLIESSVKFYFWNEKLHPAFPIDIGEFDTGENKGWIFLLSSPSIELSPPVIITPKKTNIYQCVRGFIRYLENLYDEKTDSIIPLNPLLVEEYNKVIKLIKENMVKLGRRNAWIGKEANEMFERNELEILYNGEWVAKIKSGTKKDLGTVRLGNNRKYCAKKAQYYCRLQKLHPAQTKCKINHIFNINTCLFVAN